MKYKISQKFFFDTQNNLLFIIKSLIIKQFEES